MLTDQSVVWRLPRACGWSRSSYQTTMSRLEEAGGEEEGEGEENAP